MAWLDVFGPLPGITAVIGSGGKSTLVEGLAHWLDGPTVACTTTKIWPLASLPLLVDPSDDELDRALAEHGALCVGSPAPHDKLGIPWAPGVSGAEEAVAAEAAMERLQRHCGHVVVEADGSKRLPLKAHCPWEPLVPTGTRTRILVVGASGLGIPVGAAVHRANVFCGLVGGSPQDPATPETVAEGVLAEGLVGAPSDWVVVNQADDETAMEGARALARTLYEGGFAGTVVAGSLRDERLEVLAP